MKPTIGRQVHYYEKTGNALRGPLAATVCCVHSDALVNLSVIDEDGNQSAQTSIPLLDGAIVGANREGAFCVWPPKA